MTTKATTSRPAMPDRATQDQRRLRIALIGALRHGLREPQAGGLERHTADLAVALRRRGHHVRVFASGDADPELGVEPILPTESGLDLSPAARGDVSMMSERFMAEHDAYLGLMLKLATEPLDVVHDNSLHYLPLAMARTLPAPLVKVLHTPPTPWLESALRYADDRVTTVSVSQANARQWTAPIHEIVANGVDLDVFTPGPGAGPAVWCGRIVPEKAPHLALAAAHLADVPLQVAGPCGDEGYLRAEVLPLLDDRRVWLGHLSRADLADLVGRSAVALATPVWAEPYGLVVMEALACGTPVAGFASGALPELVTDDVGVLVEPQDVTALAGAIAAASRLDRSACRAHAERTGSVDAMTAAYEALYHRLVA